MNTKQLSWIPLLAVTATPALADSDNFYGEARMVRYGNAKVIRVEPIVTRVRVSDPRQECWEETTRTYHERGRVNEAGATIFGGAVGGLVGSTLGRGNGRIVTTAAGALVGAALGNVSAQNANARSGRYVSVHPVQHCRVVEHSRMEERIHGYWVDYRFQGEVYRTRLAYRPCSHIRVSLSVDPVAP